MSSSQMRGFGRGENPQFSQNPANVDENATYHNREAPRTSLPLRDPQPQYPNANFGTLEDHNRVHQRRRTNEAELAMHETVEQMTRTRLTPQTPDHSRGYSSGQYSAGSNNQFAAANYGTQYLTSPVVNTRRESPSGQQTNISQSSSPFQRIAGQYPSPPIQGREMQNIPVAAHASAYHGQYAPPLHTNNVTPYSPGVGSVSLTPDRSTIGSPLQQMSPDSLQRELERTKDYSENILTKLIETKRLLEGRDAEIARLQEALANSGGRGWQQHNAEVGNSWEVENLRRMVREQEMALQAAQSETAKARTQAQHYQGEANWYHQEWSYLKEGQNQVQQQPQVDPVQMEESRKVTEFYKQKVDQLSRDNTSLTQQNRKLTNDLTAAQREAQQHRGLV